MLCTAVKLCECQTDFNKLAELADQDRLDFSATVL